MRRKYVPLGKTRHVELGLLAPGLGAAGQRLHHPIQDVAQAQRPLRRGVAHRVLV